VKGDEVEKRSAGLSPQLIGKLLLVVLALLVVACLGKASFLTTHGAATLRSTPTPAQDTIQFDTVEETAVPGSLEVRVTLADFTVDSSITDFRVGVPYYFVVANRGPSVHEFMIMPVKPDGSLLPPDVQYKNKLIEIEQIALGATLTINYLFSPATVGRYEIACLMRGHYEAGMKLPIAVTQ
jgi:uncharacterized cupredoxin-like copper-binding protein